MSEDVAKPAAAYRQFAEFYPYYLSEHTNRTCRRLHFVGSRSFHKCEALRFLSFVVSDHLYSVSYQIFGSEPLLNVIGGDPCGKVAKENGKAHSVYFCVLR